MRDVPASEAAAVAGLHSALRLLLITDGSGDEGRIERLVRMAVDGGARAVQLRERTLPANRLLRLCDRLRPHLEQAAGVLLVNDRVDVAVGHANGVQLGHHSLPVAEARGLLRPGQVIGASVHDKGELEAAVEARADFAMLSPVLPTSSKPQTPSLGLLRAAALTAGCPIPVLWLGGVDATAAARLQDLPVGDRPTGVAVRSAICSASHPGAAARAILAALPADLKVC